MKLQIYEWVECLKILKSYDLKCESGYARHRQKFLRVLHTEINLDAIW